MIVDLNKRWMDGAVMACVTKNPEMFFFDIGFNTVRNPGVKVQAAWNRAKAVCATCPVMQQCARDNLGEAEGVWGGLDPAQRIKIRETHAQNVRRLDGPLKVEYAQMAYELRRENKYAFADIGRIMGLPYTTAQYLDTWYEQYLERTEAAKATVLELPEEEPLAEVLKIKLEFPEKPPQDGQAWIKYGRSVVAGYYLGQTEDDAWYYFKIKLIGPDYSVCWIKAEDVKLCRDVARNVLTRVGNESRIYGAAKGTRSGRPAQVG